MTKLLFSFFIFISFYSCGSRHSDDHDCPKFKYAKFEDAEYVIFPHQELKEHHHRKKHHHKYR